MSSNQPTTTNENNPHGRLTDKLAWAEKTLSAILAGEKPGIDTADHEQNWLYEQLTRLHAGHFLPSVAQNYVTLPGDDETEMKAKGITKYHSISARSQTQRHKLADELHDAGIQNFRVMGFASSDADNLVLVPSGIKALHETICQLQKNLNGKHTKLTVIQNREGVYDPFVSFLGAIDHPLDKTLNCAITNEREATKSMLLYQGTLIDKEPVAEPSRYPKGMQMMFGSTQPKKSDETSQILLHRKLAAGVVQAVVPLHWFLSADEISRTFEGNTFEKVESMLDRVYDQVGYNVVCKRLIERGYDPERVVFCANDTGVELSEDLSGEPEFKASRHELIPNRPWPGVELGPIVDAQGGIMQFMTAVKNCRERLGRTEPLRYRDTQLYMFFKLTPKREDVVVESYFGTATGYVITNPRPTNDGSLYTEHYCVPDGQPEGMNGKTQAELGKTYLFGDSPQARCLHAMMEDLGVPHSSKPMFKHAAQDRNRRSKLRLLTQDNWLADVLGSGGIGFAQKVNENGWKLTRKEYDAFEDYAEAADAIYLGDHTHAILKDYDVYKTRLSLLFCKAGTHKQILHDCMYEKSLMICNPELRFFSENGAAHQNWADPAVGRRFIDYLKSLDPAEHPWGQDLLLYRFYHENAMIKQQPKYIWTQVEGPDVATNKPGNLSAKLRDARERFNPYPVTRYTKEEYGQDRDDLFSVTLLGSASTRNQLYTQSAYYMGQECAREGLHLRSGGGRYGIMGAGSEGMMDYWITHPKQADRSHLSAIQMPRTVQFEGLALDLKTLHKGGNSYVAIEPGMDPRMRSLFRSDVIIADAGGLGTLEEIYYFLELKRQGDPLVKDKPLIVINHPHLGKDAIHLYDALLATLPERDKKDIFVVENAQQAMDLVMDFKNNGYKPQNQRKIVDSRGLALSPA